MHLRNKKTGEIVDFITIDLTGEGEIEFVFIAPDGDERGWKYNSLESFNEEWEGYKPAEPLIKDEKIRKAVRAWAEAQELTEVYLASNGYEIYGGIDDWVMQFKGEPFPFADKNKIYTIAELCGEEEENVQEK